MALELSTADVYEQASVIGQDIERVIDLFGHESVLDLMPKVIRVLEYLEVLVGEREKENLEIAELKLENERLYVAIRKEATQRRRLDEELYQVNLQGEEENLQDVIATLKEENRKLRIEVEFTVTERPVTSYVSAPGDVEVMQKMKEIIDNQRDAIRAKNTELESQRSDLEAMAEQLERLSNINQGLRRNLSVQQERTNTLAKEKAALQTEVTTLKQEESHLQEQLEERENEQKVNGETNNNEENKENETEQQLITDKEKVETPPVVDKKDPNRPRFTRQELQDVLNERNQLKEEVLSLKEELAFYKPKEEGSKSPAKSPPTPQKEHRKSRNEESGISKIFNIFAKKEKTEDSQ